MHLTNASISKYNVNGKNVKQRGKYKILNNMWETENFQEFLINEFGAEQNSSLTCFGRDPLFDKVFP